MFVIPPEYVAFKCKIEKPILEDLDTFFTYATAVYGESCTRDVVMTGIVRSFLEGSTREVKAYREWCETRPETPTDEETEEVEPETTQVAAASSKSAKSPTQVLAEAKRTTRSAQPSTNEDTKESAKESA